MKSREESAYYSLDFKKEIVRRAHGTCSDMHKLCVKWKTIYTPKKQNSRISLRYCENTEHQPLQAMQVWKMNFEIPPSKITSHHSTLLTKCLFIGKQFSINPVERIRFPKKSWSKKSRIKINKNLPKSKCVSLDLSKKCRQSSQYLDFNNNPKNKNLCQNTLHLSTESNRFNHTDSSNLN